MALKLPLPFVLCLLLPTLAPAQEAATGKPAQPAPVDEPASAETQEEDPFASPQGVSGKLNVPAERASQPRQALRLRLETWEAPALEVVRWLDGVTDAESLGRSRSEILDGKFPARLVFSPVTTLDQSTRSLAEAIAERIYPTEYEPPRSPLASLKPEAAANPEGTWNKWLETAGKFSCPTSFETRNTGLTMEAVAQPVTVVKSAWDISVNFDSVEFLGNSSHGAIDLQVEMPMFSSFRTGGLIRLKEGQWRLLSVMEPPRGVDGKPSENRWVTLVRIDPEL
jgi:hypothetical protein